jgi:hypothetical protein
MISMGKICSTCGYELNDKNLDRCPRCYTIIQKHNKCSDCAGCGIIKCNTRSKDLEKGTQ